MPRARLRPLLLRARARRWTRPPLALLSAAVAVANPAAAAAPGGPPAATIGPGAGLAVDPLRIEPLGLTINPPETAHVSQQRVQERMTVSLLDARAAPTWSMRIQPLVPAPAAPPATADGPAARIAGLLAGLQARGEDIHVLSNRPVRFGGHGGQLCYVDHQPTPDRRIVSGWLVLDRPEDGEYLVFAIQSLPGAFPQVRRLLEASFATIRLNALSDVAIARKLRLDLGRAVLRSLTPQRLRSVLGPRRWYRHYLPATSGRGTDDTELGYFSVWFREAPLGAIDPARRERDYDPSERTAGLLVTVEGRYLDTGGGGAYSSQANYWMAWDQSEEAWSVRGTWRVKGREQSEAETGIRPRPSSGTPAEITIISSAVDGTTRDQRRWPVPEVYMSQALRWVLGEALPRDLPAARTFSSYCYDSASRTLSIALRIDRWEPLNDRSGRWKLTSRPRPGAPEIVTLYEARGPLARRQWPNGPVTEAITLDELHVLWKRKGLPTGADLHPAPRRGARPGDR